MDLNPTCYTISGVKVECPYKAYASQMALMSKIISSVQKSQNCLLESPTGSGKTLALLCSSLAWQQAEYVKIHSDVNFEVDPVENTPPPSYPNSGSPEKSGCSCTKSVVKKECDERFSSDMESWNVTQATNDDDDFKPCRNNRFAKLQSTTPTEKKEKESSGTGSLRGQCECSTKTNATNSDPSASAGGSKPSKKRVPKIYYGTRTHKQIAQVIRELRKTSYKDVRMCVLASRESTCIHEIISSDPNKNEICVNMQKGDYEERCHYHSGSTKFKGQATIINAGLSSAWDIEDLVKFGKRRRACPYYIIRGVKDDADIIFCPYNYLIDPTVRESMEISLRDNIVILDEAHNIEDTSREAGSFTLKDYELEEAVKNLRNIGQLIDEEYGCFHITLEKMMLALHDWLESQSANLTDSSVNQSSVIMTGTEMVAVLSNIGLGPDKYNTFLSSFQSIKEYEMNSENANLVLKMNAGTSFILNGLTLIFGILFRTGMPFVDDYKVAIISELSTRNFKTGKSDRFVSRHSVSRVKSLNFWCLNPAVPFTDIKHIVRSIVLTSGTLAPTNSFQSELGLSFASKLETNHVINNSQVWVGTIGAGPNSVKLEGVYKTAMTYDFQDEIGQIVLKICSLVPYGVLLFVSSYSFLDILRLRWQANGIWEEISKRKKIFCEPRGSDQSKLQDILNEFYEVVNSCGDVKVRMKRKRSQSFYEVNGALLIAVCRGKISEGLDFSDNYARAVITCGIPFPNVKDLQVELKRKYNDAYCYSRGLLSGQNWYEIQAYRALNQALGRCIRHSKDWGALIMLDSRLSQVPKYVNGLSKWIRTNVSHYGDFDCAMDSLQAFVIKQKDVNAKKQLICILTNECTTQCVPGVPFSGTPNVCSENSQDQKKQFLDNSFSCQSVSTSTPSEHKGNGDNKEVMFRKRVRPPLIQPTQIDYFIDSD